MANIHSLFVQLQSRYPMSSLVTELVQSHENLFVVRASVQIGGTTIATGMAANTVLEVAEDQARLRSLEVLGIGAALIPPTFTPIDGSSSLASTTSPPVTSSSWLESSPAPEPVAPLGFSDSLAPVESSFSGSDSEQNATVSSVINSPLADYSSTVTSSFEPIQESSLNDYSFDEPNSLEDPDPPEISYSDLEALEPVEDIVPTPAPAKPQKTTKSAKAIAPPVEDPDDFSNLIALTDIEMDRVGWTKQQGREYLKSTYGKSTRQRLDIDELMDFLNYLRALPSSNGL